MDYRYFELHDLLCDALIALEGGNRTAAASAVRRAITRLEADWLATPGDLGARPAPPIPSAHGDDTEDD